MKDISDKVIEFINTHTLIEYNDRILLSLSAGKDSMAMLHILQNLKKEYSVEIAIFHLNHLMRGDESDKDELFLSDLSKKYGLQLFSMKYDFKKNHTPGKSFEEEARDIRYQFLNNISQEHNFNKIATAHTMDDNVETVLIRIFTGTGIHGLNGINIQRGNIIRPMLSISAAEIYEYLKKNNISWREDLSNADNKYTRNYVRNIILPAVKNRFPMADKSITSLINFSKEYITILEKLIIDKYQFIYRNEKNAIYIDEDIFLNYYPVFIHILTKILRDNFKHYINQAMLKEIFKKYYVKRANLLLYRNKNIIIEKIFIKNRNEIRVSSIQDDEPQISNWEYSINLTNLTELELNLHEINTSIKVKFVDYNFFEKYKDNIRYIFVTIDNNIDIIYIRNRRNGDRINIKNGTKKIKDILIEKKLDNERKNGVPLLIIHSSIAAFMPGLLFDISNRVANNFLVNNNSKKVLAIFRN